MANNCDNYIFIQGSAEEIKEFNSLLGNTNGLELYVELLDKFCEGKLAQGDGKWFDMTYSLDTEDSITISGDSAWCPCLNLFEKISSKYPSFKIRYEYSEGGCDFAGWAEIENGETNDNCFDYWTGLSKTDPDNDSLLENAKYCVDGYDTEQALKESSMYGIFTEEEQLELLEEFRLSKTEY